MAYVLIIMLWYGSSGVAVTSAQMATEHACDMARRETLGVHDAAGIGRVRAFCTRAQ